MKKKEGKNKIKASKLEKTTASLAIISFVMSLFFLQANLTGNVTSNFYGEITSFIGAGLLIFSLALGFVWLNMRKI